MRTGQCKAARKITFLATPVVTPGINQKCAFLMQSLEIAREKDVLKLRPWDFSHSNSVVNKNGEGVKYQDFRILTAWPFPGT